MNNPWDPRFNWGHPPNAQFGLAALEFELECAGFTLEQRKRRHFFGYYRAVAC